MSTHATKRHPKFCNNSVLQFFAYAAIKTAYAAIRPQLCKSVFFLKFLLRLG